MNRQVTPEFLRVMAKLKSFYPAMAERPHAVWMTTVGSYFEELCGFDILYVQLGMRRISREHPNGFPSLGQLLDVVEDEEKKAKKQILIDKADAEHEKALQLTLATSNDLGGKEVSGKDIDFVKKQIAEINKRLDGDGK